MTKTATIPIAMLRGLPAVVRFAYDPKANRIGCAIIQAGFGGTHGVADLFPTDLWQTAPTKHTKMYECRRERLPEVLAVMLVRNREKK